VAFVINSMSVWRWLRCAQIGRFNEALAIDHVDTEYCLRARACGLSDVGARRSRIRPCDRRAPALPVSGREMQAGGHSPDRRYLIGRNTAWLARDWLWREPAFAFLCGTRLAYEVSAS
jgi:rhamnosyltransferase